MKLRPGRSYGPVWVRLEPAVSQVFRRGAPRRKTWGSRLFAGQEGEARDGDGIGEESADREIETASIWGAGFNVPGGKESAMQRRCLVFLLALILIFSFGFSGARALASTPFAIAATNVAMPSSGNGSSQYTITGVPAAGTVIVTCVPTGPISEAKIPNCELLAPPPISVEAGQTLTGTVTFYPITGAVPGSAGLRRAPRRSGRLPAAGLALAGALMFGFSFRRRVWRWLALGVFAVGAVAGLAGISGCGGNGSFNGMTPGTYPYSISAEFEETGSNVIQTVGTTINVTVP
ncbi:MAG: hypothetical protein ABSG62_18475 [Terracidiphilus sp.]